MEINFALLSNVSNMILSLHHNSNTNLTPATTGNSGSSKMKTQISSLVKGDHREGIAGTNSEIRYAVAEKVIAENPETMTILLNGETIELKANWSGSRKSVSYFGKISVETYKHFLGGFGLPKNPECYIQIWVNMNVVLSTNSRKPMFHYISESNITIL